MTEQPNVAGRTCVRCGKRISDDEDMDMAMFTEDGPVCGLCGCEYVLCDECDTVVRPEHAHTYARRIPGFKQVEGDEDPYTYRSVCVRCWSKDHTAYADYF